MMNREDIQQEAIPLIVALSLAFVMYDVFNESAAYIISLLAYTIMKIATMYKKVK
jgi:hypothetical protein